MYLPPNPALSCNAMSPPRPPKTTASPTRPVPTVTSTCQITNEGVAVAAEVAGYRLEHQVYYENGYVYIYIFILFTNDVYYRYKKTFVVNNNIVV